MNTFTVFCLYTLYATENYGTDTLIRTVEARNAFEASRVAQRIAAPDSSVPVRQLTDLPVIAVFPGHLRPALEARSFRQPSLWHAVQKAMGAFLRKRSCK
jgi:hypothetical protein